MTRIATLLGLFCLLLCLGCGVQALPDSSDNNLEAHDEQRLDSLSALYLNGDANKAIEGLKQYVADYPDDDLAWTIMGNAYTELDDYENAKKAFETALVHDKTQFRAVTGLGVLYRKAGDLDAAMTQYEKAIELDPGYAQAYSSMAVIALKRFDDKKALEYAAKGYELDQQDATVAANLAVIYHYNGDTANRDRLTKVAKDLGYANITALQQIYAGELSLRDEKPEGEKAEGDKTEGENPGQ